MNKQDLGWSIIINEKYNTFVKLDDDGNVEIDTINLILSLISKIEAYDKILDTLKINVVVKNNE